MIWWLQQVFSKKLHYMFQICTTFSNKHVKNFQKNWLWKFATKIFMASNCVHCAVLWLFWTLEMGSNFVFGCFSIYFSFYTHTQLSQIIIGLGWEHYLFKALSVVIRTTLKKLQENPLGREKPVWMFFFVLIRAKKAIEQAYNNWFMPNSNTLKLNFKQTNLVFEFFRFIFFLNFFLNFLKIF